MSAQIQALEQQLRRLGHENAVLGASVHDLGEKLKKEAEKSASAASIFEQFLKINSAYLGAEQIEGIAGLGEWVKNGQAAADAL